MSQEIAIGLALTLVAGVSSGNCMLPMKFARRWHWENLWLVFSVVSLVLIPWGLALALVNDLGSVYRSLAISQLAVPFAFGAGWGVAQVLFGLSIARLGLALGYAIIVGLSAVLGTLVPLFVQHSEVVLTTRGLLVIGGVVVMILGIAVTAWAGRQREIGEGAEENRSTSYAMALLLAVVCGLLAPMLNYSFAFGQDIAAEAVRQGTTPTRAAYAVWPIGLAGGLVPNVLYSLYLLSRNKTWNLFRPMQPGVWLAAAMGVLWMGAFALYGMSSVYLGELGTSAGWGLFQIFMIMTANGSGMLTGEWRGSPRRIVRTFLFGLLLLGVATVIIALGNR